MTFADGFLYGLGQGLGLCAAAALLVVLGALMLMAAHAAHRGEIRRRR